MLKIKYIPAVVTVWIQLTFDFDPFEGKRSKNEAVFMAKSVQKWLKKGSEKKC